MQSCEIELRSEAHPRQACYWEDFCWIRRGSHEYGIDNRHISCFRHIHLQTSASILKQRALMHMRTQLGKSISPVSSKSRLTRSHSRSRGFSSQSGSQKISSLISVAGHTTDSAHAKLLDSTFRVKSVNGGHRTAGCLVEFYKAFFPRQLDSMRFHVSAYTRTAANRSCRQGQDRHTPSHKLPTACLDTL